jgi:hypothetical protein
MITKFYAATQNMRIPTYLQKNTISRINNLTLISRNGMKVLTQVLSLNPGMLVKSQPLYHNSKQQKYNLLLGKYLAAKM